MLGGRYNPPYQFGAIYCGLSEATCWAEIDKKLEGPVRRKSFTVVALRINIQKVLNLSDPDLLSKLKIKRDQLTHPTDHTLTRLLAHTARALGFEAVLAPSSTGAGEILAIFSDCLIPPSKIAVVKPRRSR